MPVTSKSPAAAIRRIKRCKPDRRMRILTDAQFGMAQCIQQGDVYMHRVPDDFTRGKPLKLAKDGSIQVAVGSAIGARHMAEGELEAYEGIKLPPGVKAPMNVDAREILGPVLVFRRASRLNHPEHAAYKFPLITVATTYQYDPRTMRRVAD